MPKKCWICGEEIKESTAGITAPVFYSEVRNTKSKPVYVCSNCTKERIGISHEGRNLNSESEGE